jgi:Ca2+-dependent lipid-binding protein
VLANPVWHSYFEFREYEEGDKLYLKLYDKDLTNDEFIGSIYIEIEELEYSPKVCSIFHPLL